VNAIPPRAKADPTIVSAIATPRVVPVCRPAEATEVATPAIEAGIFQIVPMNLLTEDRVVRHDRTMRRYTLRRLLAWLFLLALRRR
jgi:hypothetical protein